MIFNREKNVKFVFLLPAVIFVLTLVIFPLVYSLRLSFCLARFGRNPIFIGLENYIDLLKDYKFWGTLKITLIFVLLTVSIEFFLGLTLALLFNREIRGRRYFRALLTLPMFATPVAIGYLGMTIFYEEAGPINNILALIGGPQKVPWLSNPTLAFASITLLDIWQWTPFCFVILLAGLQALPEQVYEAASLDGASGVQSLRYIILPLLGPVIVIVLLLRIVEAFKVFDVPFSLTGGGPGRATEFYSLFTYRTGLKYFNFGYASSLAYILLAIVILIITLFLKRVREVFE